MWDHRSNSASFAQWPPCACCVLFSSVSSVRSRLLRNAHASAFRRIRKFVIYIGDREPANLRAFPRPVYYRVKHFCAYCGIHEISSLPGVTNNNTFNYYIREGRGTVHAYLYVLSIRIQYRRDCLIDFQRYVLASYSVCVYIIHLYMYIYKCFCGECVCARLRMLYFSSPFCLCFPVRGALPPVGHGKVQRLVTADMYLKSQQNYSQKANHAGVNIKRTRCRWILSPSIERGQRFTYYSGNIV